MTSLLLLPWMLLPGCPQHQAKQPEAKVRVTVVVILASDRCRVIDPQLKLVAAAVQAGDPSLTGFLVVSMTQQSLAVDAKGTFPCVEDTKVEVVIHHCPDKMNKVCLGVTAPDNSE